LPRQFASFKAGELKIFPSPIDLLIMGININEKAVIK